MRRSCFLVIVLFGAAVSPAHAEWGGSVSSSASESRFDTITFRSLDQQYQLHANGLLFPAANYSASARFRRILSASDETPTDWHQEWEPRLSATWIVSLLKLSGAAQYRHNRNRAGTDRFTGQSYSVNARSQPYRLPRMYGQYSWEHNINDLELLGTDTKQRRITTGAEYTVGMLAMRYSYSDLQTRNRNSGLDLISRRHSAQINSDLRLFKRRVTIQPSYHGIFREERERRSVAGGILQYIPAIAALYANDPNPDYDSLAVMSTLNDGDVETPAGSGLDLSLDIYHNFGLDFGAPVIVDHLYLYTDTLANPLLPWAIYISDDNLNWRRAVDYAVYSFSIPFLRYELTFPALTARYIKIVMRPQPQMQSVPVTELRALVMETESSRTTRPLDHRGSLGIRYEAASWLSLYADGNYTQTGRTTTTQERRYRNIATGFNLPLASRLRLSARYQYATVRYSQPFSSGTDSESASASWEARWLSSLTSQTSVVRSREFVEGREVRIQNTYSIQILATVFPQLHSQTLLNLAEDQRIAAHDLNRSRSFRQTFTTRPTYRSQMDADYSWQRTHSRIFPVSSRQAVGLRGSYQLTARINVRGDLSYSEESSGIYRAWSGYVSWAITRTVGAGSSYGRTVPSQGGGNEIVSADLSFRPTPAMDWLFGFSRGRYADTPQNNSTNLRLSFNLRF